MDNYFLMALEDLDFQSKLIVEELEDIAYRKELPNLKIGHGHPFIVKDEKLKSIIFKKEIFLLDEDFNKIERRELFSVVSFQQTDKIM